MSKANETQHGGDHYTKLTVQPWDVILAWDLGFLAGNAVKYIARYRSKGKPKEDIAKAIHYLQKLHESLPD